METSKKTIAFFRQVYLWMFAGLLSSTLSAGLVVLSPALQTFIFGNMMVFFALVIVELGLVVAISAAIKKISTETARLLFIIYSLLNGLTISIVLLVYTGASVLATFLVAALMFGTMALWGFFTDKDLSKLGPILFMALIGIIIAMVVNFFLKSSTFDLIVSFLGVILFTLLTAYDNQYLKRLSTSMEQKSLNRFAIIGALKLYLDFINLFLFLLRFLGKARE